MERQSRHPRPTSHPGGHTELMNHNGLYRKLNEMQFEFGVITQSLVLEGLSESRLTPLEKEEKFLFIGRQQIKQWLIDIKIIPANFLFF